MTADDTDFALPKTLEPSLAEVRAYWERLKRADNSMPFWDDVRLSALPDLAGRLLLIDAFEKPERFRFNTVGKALTERYGSAVNGRFIDEAELKAPFELLLAQCSATVAQRAPTYQADGGSARILLPMWGDGRIGMLLGCIDQG